MIIYIIYMYKLNIYIYIYISVRFGFSSVCRSCCRPPHRPTSVTEKAYQSSHREPSVELSAVRSERFRAVLSTSVNCWTGLVTVKLWPHSTANLMPNVGRMWRTWPFAHANASVVGNSYKSIKILSIKHTSPSYTKLRFTTTNWSHELGWF